MSFLFPPKKLAEEIWYDKISGGSWKIPEVWDVARRLWNYCLECLVSLLITVPDNVIVTRVAFEMILSRSQSSFFFCTYGVVLLESDSFPIGEGECCRIFLKCTYDITLFFSSLLKVMLMLSNCSSVDSEIINLAFPNWCDLFQSPALNNLNNTKLPLSACLLRHCAI